MFIYLCDITQINYVILYIIYNLESSAVTTILKKVSFHTDPKEKAMPRNAQTTAQLHSAHTLAMQCSNFSKPGFNSMWAMKFQILNMELEKPEEPEVKLPTSGGSSRKQESSIKTSTSALSTMPKPLTVWITTNCGKFFEMGIPDHLTFSWEIGM